MIALIEGKEEGWRKKVCQAGEKVRHAAENDLATELVSDMHGVKMVINNTTLEDMTTRANRLPALPAAADGCPGGRDSLPCMPGIDISRKRYISLFFIGVFLLALIAGFTVNTHRQTVGKFIDDSVIASGIEAVMIDDPVLKTTRIDVESFRGVVLLSGFVDSSRTAGRAVKLAGSVPGVNSIKNSIVVK